MDDITKVCLQPLSTVRGRQEMHREAGKNKFMGEGGGEECAVHVVRGRSCHTTFVLEDAPVFYRVFLGKKVCLISRKIFTAFLITY